MSGRPWHRPDTHVYDPSRVVSKRAQQRGGLGRITHAIATHHSPCSRPDPHTMGTPPPTGDAVASPVWTVPDTPLPAHLS